MVRTFVQRSSSADRVENIRAERGGSNAAATGALCNIAAMCRTVEAPPVRKKTRPAGRRFDVEHARARVVANAICDSSVLLLLLEDLVDEPVLFRLAGAHVEVAIDVLRDLVAGLTRRLDEDLRDHVLHVTDLSCLDLDVGRLTARAAEWLVNHHARMRQRVSLPLLAGAEQHGRHARRLPEAQSADRA